MDGVWLSPEAASPPLVRESIEVCGWQPVEVPSQVSRRKTCAWSPLMAAYATYRPFRLTAGVSSETAPSEAEFACALAAVGQVVPAAWTVTATAGVLVPPPLPVLPGTFGTCREGGL